MRSVADELRDEQLRDLQKLTPEERIELALRLGEEGLQVFMATHGVSRREAIRHIRRQRSAGRTPSRCMDDE